MLILLLWHAAFENGHTSEGINLMMNNSINISKLQIIRKMKDCTYVCTYYIYSEVLSIF